MKRILTLLLCFILLLGCNSAGKTRSEYPSFFVSVPEPFEEVRNASVLCFAPYGDPLLSSSITVASTERNWYFDQFMDTDYESFLKAFCGYEDLKLKSVADCTLDGYSAKKAVCDVTIDQGIHTLIIYAINADKTYFFILLNRENDPYIESFDTMMESVRFKGGK